MIAAVYSPMVCVIAQDKKRVIAGDTILDYDMGKYQVSSVDLPVTARVRSATTKHPYLALSLQLDPKLLASVLLDLPKSNGRHTFHRGVAASPNSPALLEALVRLLRLLDTPEDISHLAPLVLREI